MPLFITHNGSQQTAEQLLLELEGLHSKLAAAQTEAEEQREVATQATVWLRAAQEARDRSVHQVISLNAVDS